MSATQPAPAHWESDVVLLDGGTVHVRPIRPEDGTALVAFHERLPPDTVYSWFFSAKPRLSAAEVEYLTHLDHDARVALVADLGDRIVAVARYDRTAREQEAEVAFVVADEHQGRGIGTVLLEHLASAARERGSPASSPRRCPATGRCSRSPGARGSTRQRAPAMVWCMSSWLSSRPTGLGLSWRRGSTVPRPARWPGC
jgi:GNAT superfamily N-acetyltransferase